MNLDYAWLVGLRDYLVHHNTDNPPCVETEGVHEVRPFQVIQLGRYLDDPQQDFGVLTIHLGDVEDASWWHERITEQQRMGGGVGHQLFGGYQEIGGGTQWWFRYSMEMRLYYTLTGYDQVLALAHATEAIHWVLRLTHELNPRVLGVGKTEGYRPVYQVATSFKPEERGGDNNWIWFCKLHLQLYVHADKAA